LLTPPLTFTPGHARLISRAASMKFFAKSLCSSMPVATARMFGSKMMSRGSNPARSVSSAYARRQIATFRSTVSACPASSNAMTTTPAP
jgi:hypothetical protein